MNVLFALLIAVLSAIESLLLALLFISLLVAPGGSGEFTGIAQFADSLFAGMIVPPLTFVIVFVLVMKYDRPENHKWFRRFAWALAAAVLTAPVIRVLTATSRSRTRWDLIINAMVLAVWTAVILWQRVTDDESVET